MSTFNSDDHPRNHPTNRGAFSDHTHSAPESSLSLGSAPWSINPAFPEPQANSLEKVASSVDAVFAGANTAEAIAEALDVSGREGSYYANAAGYLGLLETSRDDVPTTFNLTASGQQLYAMAAAERTGRIAQFVAETPGIQILEADGVDALNDYLSEAGLDGQTVGRRTATIVSWWEATVDLSRFQADTETELTATHVRALAAAQHAAEARLERVQAAAVRDARCTSCGNQLPLSGLCDFCG